MANNKKYYWLKLKENFFKQREIKKLRKIAGGDTYTIIYLKMQLLAIKNEGWLYFEGTENDIFEQLELELDESLENIQVTIQFLKHNNLVEMNDQQDCFLPETALSIGKEGQSAERVRRHREKTKQQALQSNTLTLQSNNGVTKSNTEIEIDIEIEEDIDIEVEEEVKEKLPSSSSTQNIFNFYGKNVGMLTPYISELLTSYIDDELDEELILEVLKVSVERGKTNFGYIKAILNQCINKNIKSVIDFKKEQQEFQNKKKTNNREEVDFLKNYVEEPEEEKKIDENDPRWEKDPNFGKYPIY